VADRYGTKVLQLINSLEGRASNNIGTANEGAYQCDIGLIFRSDQRFSSFRSVRLHAYITPITFKPGGQSTAQCAQYVRSLSVAEVVLYPLQTDSRGRR